MSDFTTFNLEYNINTDISPTWSGTAIAFGGTGGANEIRFVNSGLGAGGSTSSAAWPLVTKPASGTAVFNQIWAFTADTTGTQIIPVVLGVGYQGDNTVARVFRWNWDNVGTFASSPQFSCFDSTSHNAPSPGTQPSIVNGSADTSSTSYIKGNAYGNGVTAGGAQHTPGAGSVGSNPTATTGVSTPGSAVPPSTPAWLTTWQDLQGWTDYIVDFVTPQATTAGFWYLSLILFYSSSISASTYTFCMTLQYTYS